MMNNDLISRKALVAALIKEREQYPPMVAERYSFGVKLPHRFNQAMRGGIRKALRLVETAPAVEATPVRHARYGFVGPHIGSTCSPYAEHGTCIACKERILIDPYHKNYCPNCGTKMDLEEE